MGTIGIIVAHPDDEVLGCGGTIARLALTNSVCVLILGTGATARGGETTTQSAAQHRLADAAGAAGRILGADSVMIESGLPDNEFDSVPLLSIVKRVEHWLGMKTPSHVVTHNPMCLNVDHRLTCQAVLTATRPLTSSVCGVYAFETPSATEWAFGALGAFQPTVFYDITTTLERKIHAMGAYVDEARKFPNPRSPEALRALATWRGVTAGCSAAEAFMVLRETR